MTLMPFVLFDGNCAEAMEFYQASLGGELSITRARDTPMKDRMPPQLHERIVYAHLKSDAIEFSGTDWLHPTRARRPGNNVCLYVSGGTYPELRGLFDKLAVGADPALLDEPREEPFGIYGHLADKYGVHWFFRGDKTS